MIDHEDEVLLSRYADGEVTPAEKALLESRLVRNPELRAELADMILLKASLRIGLAGARRPGGPAPVALAAGAAAGGLGSREPGPVPARSGSWLRAHVRPLAAASIACIAVAAGVWWQLRPRPATGGAHPGPCDAVIDGLDASVDKDAIRRGVVKILDPKTSWLERTGIYESWCQPKNPAIEPLVWMLAPLERDAGARAILYTALVDGGRDYQALLAAAWREWSERALDPLTVLITHLRFHPTPETEKFFLEIAKVRLPLDVRWRASSLLAFQRAFPKDGPISQVVSEALHDPEELVRANAGLARVEVGDPAGLAVARELLPSRSPDVRKMAAVTISRHGPESVPLLKALLDDPDPDVRAIAERAFKDHGLPIPSHP